MQAIIENRAVTICELDHTIIYLRNLNAKL
ncbi:MAG: hypothetical protein BMS9Abin11_0818 [Gammaproteobacteria bacterium]|nr:MAG: hypothetical protein BMS9Abin11_0818 [Gammaproteobacteria bacterium]